MRATRRGLVLRWALLLLVVGGFALALRGQWGDVVAELGRLDPLVVVGAFVLSVGAASCSFVAWAAVLADLGSRVRWRAGARIFFVGQLGKYLPGAVWPVLVQMRLGARLQLPRRRMAVTFVVTLGLSLAWGLLIGLSAVPALLAGAGAGYVWLLVALPLLAVFLLPRPLNALLALALRLARRPPLEHPLSGRGVVAASGGVVLFWLLAGLSVWVLLLDLGAPQLPSLPVALGGFALAFCAGPLLVVFPAGAGVREAVLSVILATVVSTPEAVAVALVSRFLLAATDGALAAVSAALGRSARAAG